MYKNVGELNLPETENEVLKFWKDNKIKEKCLNNNKQNGKVYSFFEGPPTANGQPHAGHILTRALKDVFTRVKSMQGFYVPRKGGWDTHGLPVELEVEKEIGISGKKQIEEYGIENFINKCKTGVWKYVDEWKNFSNKVGYFVDMDNDFYYTYDDKYIESVWWSLKELDKKGLLYKGYKILPSCPSCGTALSSHEVAQGYRERNDLTVVAKFKALDETNLFYLVWTTTPWTLPSNVALCVNPNFEYVKILAGNVKYILAKNLVPSLFKENEYEILETFKGKDLEFKKYEPIFDFASKDIKEKSFYFTCDEYVTLTDGTGIVHIAPAYGVDDSNVGTKYGLPFLQLANSSGKFEQNCGEYSGQDIFKVNEKIAEDLNKQGKIFKAEKHKHEYPHCWRCKSPLMYIARSGWFIKTTAIKDKLIEENQKINWLPSTIKDGRMGNWLENVIDWCLSRDRYWGTPLPVWKCECGHYVTVGSKEELKKLAGIQGDIELHKPYVDEIKIKCEKCGKMMTRELDVIDCWYDSGSMPFAQFHYPFENKTEFASRFPADFISEGVDQCRGWFYAMLVINVALFGKSPYKSVIANGLVVDEQGQKLSKSLGNFTPPMELLREVGADAVRWTFYTEGQPWANLGMTPAIAKATVRSYFGTLWNVYSFFVLYAEIDKFNPSEYEFENCKFSVMDKWILSEFNTLVKNVTTELNQLHCTEPARAMQDFINDLSNWYIRRSRKRYWVGGMTEDKKSAYMTLWYVLTEFAKLSAPFTPFISETIYQNLVANFFKNNEISVHLARYPVANEKMIDEKLRENMKLTYTYTELGRKARSTYNLKIRQPLSKLYLTDATEKTDLSADMIKILQEELNVKEVIQNADLNEFMAYKLKPQLRTLGPKYGKFLNDIKEFLNTCDASIVVKTVKAGNVYKFEIKGNKFELTLEDILIEAQQKENYASSVLENFAVVLDTTLTPELIGEGYVREFVSKIQNLRKDSGFEVTDRIEILIYGDENITNIIMQNAKSIAEDVLAVKIEKSKNKQPNTLELNDKVLTVLIKKVK